MPGTLTPQRKIEVNTIYDTRFLPRANPRQLYSGSYFAACLLGGIVGQTTSSIIVINSRSDFKFSLRPNPCLSHSS